MEILVTKERIPSMAIRTDYLAAGCIAQETVRHISLYILTFTLPRVVYIPDMRVMATGTPDPSNRRSIPAEIKNRNFRQQVTFVTLSTYLIRPKQDAMGAHDSVGYLCLGSATL